MVALLVMRSPRFASSLALALFLAASACSSTPVTPDAPVVPASEAERDLDDLNEMAHAYLELELAMGLHDSAHVDAYFGPDSLKQAAEASPLGLEEIEAQAGRLIKALAEYPVEKSGDSALRVSGLRDRLDALRTRVAMAQGQKFSFDQEARRLFGVEPPHHGAEHFDAILAEVSQLVPGEGSLSERVNAFQKRFVIPADKLEFVFETAMAECRRRTLEHIELPEGESFTIEYVTDKPWSGYNWYQGDARSLIQVNTDLPIFIHRAVDLGCHEGYPGHHTYNALIEATLVRERGWLEYSLYPLFSPQSLVAEGSGNFGIELAFPGDERVVYEREVLFPLAGLDAEDADRYYRLLALIEKLDYAGNEAARGYLDGTMTREAAVAWLRKYLLYSLERATQRTKFFDAYRSYVINYNLGEDLVRGYIDQAGTDPGARWRRFGELLASPVDGQTLSPATGS